MKIKKTIFSLVLSSAMLSSAAIPAFAAEPEKGEIYSSGYTFSPHDYNYDLKTDKVIYTDEYFSFSAKSDNPHLATASMAFAAAGIGATSSFSTNDPTHMPDNVKEFLENLGFEGFSTNKDYLDWGKADGSSLGVGGAAKKITVNGKQYTLFAFSPRNANYGKEWAQNMNIGKADENGEEAVGFRLARDRYLEFLKEYIDTYYKDNPDAPKDIKIWTVGYSRGAGTINIAIPYLFSHKDEFLPEDVAVTADDLYVYTYGTPSSAWIGKENEKADELASNEYVHNYYTNYDHTTFLAFSEWGFWKNGKNNIINLDFDEETKQDNPERKEQMLSFLKELSPATYDSYTAEFSSSYDPSTFAVYRFKDDGSFGVELDPENPTGIPENLGDFEKERFDRIRLLSDDRDSYTENYQEIVMLLAEYFKGDYSSRPGKLISGIASAPDIKLTAAMTALWYLVDRFMTVYDIDSSDVLKKYREEIEYQVLLTEYCLDNMRDQIPLTDEEIEGMRELMAFIKQKLPMLEIETTIPEKLETSLKALLAGDILRAAPEAGYSDEEIQRFLGENNKNIIPMINVITAVALSSDNESFDIVKRITEAPYIDFNWHCDQLNILATVVGNARHFTGTAHKNEVILSWLKVNDSYYTDKDHFGAYRTLSINKPECDAKIEVEYAGNKIVLDITGEGFVRTEDNLDMNVYTNLVDGKITVTVPFGADYKVKMIPSQNCIVNSTISEYKIDGEFVETKTVGSSGRSFENIKLSADKELVYTLSDRGEGDIVKTAEYDVMYEEPKTDPKEDESSDPKKEDDNSKTDDKQKETPEDSISENEKQNNEPSSVDTVNTGETSSAPFVFAIMISASFAAALMLVLGKNKSFGKQKK